MNILHICSYYENVLFENLVKALDKQGINNEVFVFFPKEQARQNFERERTNVVLKFCYSKKDRCIFHLKHNKVVQCFTEEYHARINNFDVIYAHSLFSNGYVAVSYTHLRAHETGRNLVCRLLLEKKKKKKTK